MPAPSIGIAWLDALLKARDAAVPAAQRERTQNWVDYFESLHPGRHGDAFLTAKDMRHQVDRDVANPARHDLDLRDAEHYLFSRDNVAGHPLFGRLAVLYSAPAYSALKVAAQNYPWTLPALAPIFDPILKAKAGTTMEGLKQSTPPDLSELYWGVKPVFERLPDPPEESR